MEFITRKKKETTQEYRIEETRIDHFEHRGVAQYSSHEERKGQRKRQISRRWWIVRLNKEYCTGYLLLHTGWPLPHKGRALPTQNIPFPIKGRYILIHSKLHTLMWPSFWKRKSHAAVRNCFELSANFNRHFGRKWQGRCLIQGYMGVHLQTRPPTPRVHFPKDRPSTFCPDSGNSSLPSSSRDVWAHCANTSRRRHAPHPLRRQMESSTASRSRSLSAQKKNKRKGRKEE